MAHDRPPWWLEGGGASPERRYWSALRNRLCALGILMSTGRWSCGICRSLSLRIRDGGFSGLPPSTAPCQTINKRWHGRTVGRANGQSWTLHCTSGTWLNTRWATVASLSPPLFTRRRRVWSLGGCRSPVSRPAMATSAGFWSRTTSATLPCTGRQVAPT